MERNFSRQEKIQISNFETDVKLEEAKWCKVKKMCTLNVKKKLMNKVRDENK